VNEIAVPLSPALICFNGVACAAIQMNVMFGAAFEDARVEPHLSRMAPALPAPGQFSYQAAIHGG
jgi:hypothetical protein